MAQALFKTLGGTFLAETPLERVKLNPDESLIRVIGSSICEADRRSITGSKQVADAPLSVILGHGAVGGVMRTGRGSGLKRGDVVSIMPHQIPTDQRQTTTFQRGEIFKLHTRHAGMHCDGTMASHVIWPSECLCRVPRETVANRLL